MKRSLYGLGRKERKEYLSQVKSYECITFSLLNFCFFTGPILKAKAIELHKMLSEARGDQPMKEFVASEGWLWRFSKRHGIRQLSLQGEKLSADKPAAEHFVATFQAFIEENNYTLNQIFNCDETGLYYKLLPKKTLPSHFEKSADGWKGQKERVTINACSNALGTIKLPLLFIGKYKKPRCFKNISRESLPVIYENQSNAWVNREIFAKWFHGSFVPTVKRKLIELGIEPKAVLLLDNCSANPDETELMSSDGKIIAKFLPPNVTSLIQPMDQGVLESMKRRYRRKILEELILKDDEGLSMSDYLKSMHMLQVITLVSASWAEISAETLRLSWRKILPESPSPQSTEPGATQRAVEQNSIEEFTSLFQILGQTLSEDEVSDWLQTDQYDMGYTHLTDNEIVSSVINTNESEDDSDTDEATLETVSSVSHTSALKMFDGCIKWLQEQEEACMYNIQSLQELRDLASRKRFSAIKQKKISDYIPTT